MTFLGKGQSTKTRPNPNLGPQDRATRVEMERDTIWGMGNGDCGRVSFSRFMARAHDKN